MSANNWDVCPKCNHDAQQGAKAALKAAQESYGKVPADEYLAAVEAAESYKAPGNTLREDYEIGIFENSFDVRYQASCTVCGFKYEYTVHRPAFTPETVEE